MNPAWFFVIASVVAVLGIGVAFKQLMEKVAVIIEEHEHVTSETFMKVQSTFFLRIVIIEIIPILLVIVAFIQLSTYEASAQTGLVIPFVLVVLCMVLGVGSVLVAKNQIRLNEQAEMAKRFVTSFVYIGIALINAFPIISIVGMMTMLLQ